MQYSKSAKGAVMILRYFQLVITSLI